MENEIRMGYTNFCYRDESGTAFGYEKFRIPDENRKKYPDPQHCTV
jgi:hypothetical protein